MRRLIGIGLAAAMLLAPASGCKKKRQPSAAGGQQASTEPATMLGVADPRAALQLTKGFHEVENGGWRWSAREFSAALKAPASGTQKGATLLLKFSVMEPSITRLGPLTLSAKVGSTQCPAQHYDKAGEYEYKCDIPPAMLAGAGLVAVDFTLDKALPATETDARELGLVVAMVGFEAK